LADEVRSRKLSAPGILLSCGFREHENVVVVNNKKPIFFGVNDFGERCNEKEAKDKEQVVYIMRQGV
jgi:hypothetical protein